MGSSPFSRLSLAAVAAGCVSAMAMTGVAAAAPFNLKIINSSGQNPSNVYVMLHNNAGNAASLDGQLTDSVPKQLSAINNSTVLMGDISAARLFVSYGAPVGPNEPNDNTTTTRYDKIEFTNPGVANLTAVDFFAIPLGLQALDSSGDTVGDALSYRCYTDTLSDKLAAISPGAELNYAGNYVRNWSPGLFPDAFASTAPYLASMTGKTITIDDRFDANGPPPVHDAINYTGTFAADGSITLNGTLTPNGGPPAAGHPVVIQGANLNGLSEQGIYTGNGDFTVNGVPAHVGDNDQYSVIYRDIVAGFALGYWGGKYGDSVSAWKGQPDFAAARNGTDPFAAYNQYAATIADYSYAYGYSFHDMGPTAVATPLISSVETLEMTIDPDAGPNTPGCVGSSTPSTPSTPSNPSPPNSGGGRVSMTIDRDLVKLDKRGRALVRLSCKGDPCIGDLSLSATEKAKPRRRGRGHRSVAARRKHPDKRKEKKKSRQVELGRTGFKLAEGQTREVFVDVTRKGRAMIDHSHGHRLRALAKALVGPVKSPTVAGQRAVTLKAYKPPRKYKRKRR